MAAILLLVATITAPVVNRLSLLRVELNDNQGTAISFGTFGYCMLGGGNSGDYCSARNVGYHPSDVVSAAENSGFGSTAASAANGLTGAMVLHPVACVLTFIAFLVAMGAGVIGSLASFLISVLAFILTLVVMAIDFTLFGVRYLCTVSLLLLTLFRSFATMSTRMERPPLPTTIPACGASWPPSSCFSSVPLSFSSPAARPACASAMIVGPAIVP